MRFFYVLRGGTEQWRNKGEATGVTVFGVSEKLEIPYKGTKNIL